MSTLLQNTKEILLGDYEEKVFQGDIGFFELLSLLKAQKESDIWTEPYISETSVKELMNCPIMTEQILEDLSLSCSKEQIEEAMNNIGLVFTAPGKSSLENFLLRETAISSLCDRAGLNGPSITKAYKEHKEILQEILNKGLSLWEDKKGKLLLRDNKISAFHSSEYAVLPTYDLLISLQKQLDQEFPGWEMDVAYLTHSMLRIRFSFPKQQKEILMQLNRALKRKGIKEVDGIPTLEFCSSDTAKSGANLLTGLMISGNFIRTAKDLKVKHYGSASISDFVNNCSNIYMLFKDATEKLEKLANVEMRYPIDAFIHLACDLKLPKKSALMVAEEFDLTRPRDCSALDVYFKLWEINVKEHQIACAESLIIQESITRALNKDFSNYDHPYKWM